MYASAPAATATPSPILALTTATTNASRHHAVASPTAAHASAVAPIGLVVSPRSARIRARTGNAVMDIATPMNSEKLVKETSAVARRG